MAANFRLNQLSWIAFAICGSGCSGTYPFSGRVEFEDGGAVPLAVVEFREEKGIRSGVTHADPNGEFTNVMFERPGQGLPAGSYKILVNPPQMMGLSEAQVKLSPGPGWGIPEEYRKAESSGLRVTIPLADPPLRIKIKRQSKNR